MTGGSGAKDDPHPFTDETRALGIDVDDPRASAWMEAHLPEFRQQASGQRPLYWILGIGFVVGLAAHVGGFLLRSSATTDSASSALVAIYWRTASNSWRRSWRSVLVAIVMPMSRSIASTTARALSFGTLMLTST